MKQRLQIGVFGHHSNELPNDIVMTAESVGRKIAGLGHFLITGASTGVSYYAAKGAKSVGGLTIGFVPQTLRENSFEHISTEYIDIVIASGFGYKGRNVLSVRSCNAAIFINGGIGTLNELLIAIDEMVGKCFIVQNSGGVSNVFSNIMGELGINVQQKVFICNIEALFRELELL